MQPNPYPEGSEEASWYDDQREKAMMPAAIDIATTMAGPGSLMAERGAVGAVGGKLLPGLGTTTTSIRDYATKNTKNWYPMYNSEGEARALAREKLGANPVEVEANKWRSSAGKWQYRAKSGDVSKNHVHLEELNPNTARCFRTSTCNGQKEPKDELEAGKGLLAGCRPST